VGVTRAGTNLDICDLLDMFDLFSYYFTHLGNFSPTPCQFP